MKFKNANNTQRFLAYLIDFLIIEAVVSFLSGIIFGVMNFDINMKNSILAKLMEEIGNVAQTGDMTNYMKYYMEFIKYMFVEMGVQMGTTLLTVVIYLVIIPKLWEKQTVGRLVSKTKVVMVDDSKLNNSGILLRELVGTFLLYYCTGMIAYVISLVFINKEQRSLVDKVSKTKLVSLNDVILETPKQEAPADSIDAHFEEVKEATEQDKEEVVEPEKNDEIKTDDDGYVVF